MTPPAVPPSTPDRGAAPDLGGRTGGDSPPPTPDGGAAPDPGGRTPGDSPPPTPDEVMTVTAARALRNGRSCFVGIGLPSAAANLARRLHAPSLVLIYESGTIGSKPGILPLSIGDGELAETADAVVSVPEIFAYWLQAGRIDVGFLGAAQIDRSGNLNTTVIGPWERPRVRLPGAGGAPEIAAHVREVLVVLRHTSRTFVEGLDFVTSAGRPSRVITDLGVLEPHAETGELVLVAVHPGVEPEQAREATGWPLRVAPSLRTTEPVRPEELRVLRDLQERTRRAHAARGGSGGGPGEGLDRAARGGPGEGLGRGARGGGGEGLDRAARGGPGEGLGRAARGGPGEGAHGDPA